MTTDGELYERDPEAWNAYLAEGNAKQARKRVSADAIVRDSSGRILLVDPTYKPDWDLPGGMAEANEPPADAVRRELREELGLDIQVGDLLCVDWVSPHGPWDDLLNFIFDGGTLSDSDINGLQLVDSELRAFEFCDEGQAKERLRPYVWRRASAAWKRWEPAGHGICRTGTHKPTKDDVPRLYLAYTRLVPGCASTPPTTAWIVPGWPTGVSTDSARGRETTGKNRHQPDNQDMRTGRPTRRRTARFPARRTREPQVSGRISPLQQLPRHHHPLDLVGALVDLGDLGVAHHPLDRVVGM